jgi:hypothetical protein
MVFLVFLTVFAMAAASSFRIGAMAQSRLSLSLAQQSFEELCSKIAECCALGEGNAREVALSSPASITAEGSVLSFSSGSFFASRNFSCEIISVAEPGQAKLAVENLGGAIEVR